MFAPRRLAPFFALILWGGVGMMVPAQSEPLPRGFQDQRYATPRIPGRSPSMFHQLRRENDLGRHYSGENVQLTRDIAIRQGRAYLFRSAVDGPSDPEISGTLEGKGAYLTIIWPP